MNTFSSIRSTRNLVVFAAALLSSAGTAWAGCNPACKTGEVCRYEAAGDKFYCAAAKGAAGSRAPGFTAPGDVAGRAPATSKSLSATKPANQIDMGPMPGRVRDSKPLESETEDE